MSYDISIADESFNYTSNMSKFFHDFIWRGRAMPGNQSGWQTFQGCKGHEVALILKQSLHKIARYRFDKDNRDLINNTALHFRIGRHYDPDNYWGDVMSASVFMAQVMAACYENPDDVFSVWS